MYLKNNSIFNLCILSLFLVLSCTVQTIVCEPCVWYEDIYDKEMTNKSVTDLAEDKTDDMVPEYLRSALIRASTDADLNQYLSVRGHTRLINAVANFYSSAVNHKMNESNILITAGATEGVYDTLHALTQPGDEWILIEPYWIKYKQLVELAGGVPRYATLTPINNKKYGTNYARNWQFNKEQFAKLFNKKTRGVILNNPHNPTGKVFTREELQFIADLAEKHNTIVVVDEVFEFTIFGSIPFTRFASLPNMFDRTITVTSASKSFLVSGWRVGWVYGEYCNINKIKTMHSAILASSPTLAQDAVAYGLELEKKYFGTERSFTFRNTRRLRQKKDLLLRKLHEAGITTYTPEAGDCLLGKLPKIKEFEWDFTKNDTHWDWFTTNIGVFVFPLSSYYSPANKHLGKDSFRFCYQKKVDTIMKAGKKLLLLKAHRPEN